VHAACARLVQDAPAEPVRTPTQVGIVVVREEAFVDHLPSTVKSLSAARLNIMAAPLTPNTNSARSY